MSVMLGPVPSQDLLPSYSRRQHQQHRRRHSAMPSSNHTRSPTEEPARQTEHVFELTSPSRACLKMMSSAKTSKSLPTFFEKEMIKGEVEVDLDRGGVVIGVTAIISGRIIAGLHDVTFLSESYPLWTRTNEKHGKKDMILTLPFSIMLPRTIQGAQSKLPETFLERHTKSSIQYDFTIIIERHGGLLKNDSKIKTAFGYVPSVRSEAPTSLMRQLAYTQHAAVPGPRSDPDPNAWTLVKPTVSNIGGKLKGKGAVNIQCELSLANPLSYTRGSIIPVNVWLSASAGSEAALAVLGEPSAVSVVLRRKVTVCAGKSTKKPTEETTIDVASAILWASGDGQPGTRELDGEIHIPKDVRPSCNIPGFTIEYFIVLEPFNAPGYSAPSSRSWPLVCSPVTIGTVYPSGPRPIAYAPPPAYSSSSSSPRAVDDLSYTAPSLSPRSFLFNSRI